VGISLCAIGLGMRVLGEIVGITGIPLCHGSYAGAFFGLAVLASYLYLFKIFYAKTYVAGKSNVANGAARLHKKKPVAATASVSAKDD
jgi:hypothetical protein